MKSEIQLEGDIDEVWIFGDPGLEVEVMVRPEKLTEYGLSFGHVASEINTVLTSSAIGDMESNQYRFQVSMAANDVSNLKNRVIRNRSGLEVSIGELAEIRIGQDLNPMQKVRVDGSDAVVLGVRVKDGTNIHRWLSSIEKPNTEVCQVVEMVVACVVMTEMMIRPFGGLLRHK